MASPERLLATIVPFINNVSGDKFIKSISSLCPINPSEKTKVLSNITTELSPGMIFISPVVVAIEIVLSPLLRLS